MNLKRISIITFAQLALVSGIFAQDWAKEFKPITRDVMVARMQFMMDIFWSPQRDVKNRKHKKSGDLIDYIPGNNEDGSPAKGVFVFEDISQWDLQMQAPINSTLVNRRLYFGMPYSLDSKQLTRLDFIEGLREDRPDPRWGSDCSGSVSMAWALPKTNDGELRVTPNTSAFSKNTDQWYVVLEPNQLKECESVIKPGDALVFPPKTSGGFGHIRLVKEVFSDRIRCLEQTAGEVYDFRGFQDGFKGTNRLGIMGHNFDRLMADKYKLVRRSQIEEPSDDHGDSAATATNMVVPSCSGGVLTSEMDIDVFKFQLGDKPKSYTISVSPRKIKTGVTMNVNLDGVTIAADVKSKVINKNGTYTVSIKTTTPCTFILTVKAK